MSPEIKEAIDNARNATVGGVPYGPQVRPASFERARAIIYDFLLNVPDGVEVSDLRDELSNAGNQGAHSNG